MSNKDNTQNFIRIKGARVHNLKNLSADIPKNKLVVITGLSGSGKSSLAFDTIYAEAERRFVESLSSYARQFLGIKDKPEADHISGLSPAIAIDQKSVSKNPRSTVGTITEIHDYLRILFARLGTPHCPDCFQEVKKQGVDEMIRKISSQKQGSKILIMAPIISNKKGQHKNILANIKKEGFLRVRLNGGVMRIEEAMDIDLDPQKKHSIEIVVDRITLDKDTERARLVDSVETSLRVGKGIVIVVVQKNGFDDFDVKDTSERKEIIFSESFACSKCGVSMPPIEPRLFSFNSPYGACTRCTGLGNKLEVDPDLVIPNKNLTLAEGAIQPWSRASHRVGRQSWYWWMLEDLADRHNFDVNLPIKNLPQKIINLILYGEGVTDSLSSKNKSKASKFEGVIPNLERRWKETESEWTRGEIERYMRMEKCPECEGRRLKPETLAVLLKIKNKKYNISDVSNMSVEDAIIFFKDAQKVFSKNGADGNSEENKHSGKNKIASPLLKEVIERLQFLVDVGLEYLTLNRSSVTLSGGEAQRVRLATQIGSGLSGVIYVLDEPSIGLHPRDHARLIKTLQDLRDLGNTVLVVEHDLETIQKADWVLDVGPGAGRHGGKVIFEGTPKDLKRAKTLTAEYYSGKKNISIPTNNSADKKKINYLSVVGASENNLKDITAKIPLERLVCVSGVSGSGKSTLINDILSRSLRQHFYGSREAPGKHKSINGIDNIDKVVVVDQSPIGRTPRSNPATYTNTFSFIRDLFAATRDARSRGYKAGRFSFNVKGGRCEECEGQGVKKIEMYFLPDIYVECEECHGTRYNKESLSILYNGKNISEVLDMSCDEAILFFKNIPQIHQRLKTLVEVGLGYMKLGQPATTLSGGEAQRVKLATELAKKETGKTLYILDEPTTGLHAEDTQKLMSVLRALVDGGNSILVIEHNIEVLRNADWIIDLGPEGGSKGGTIVAEGEVKDIMKNNKSYTGRWMKKSPHKG